MSHACFYVLDQDRAKEFYTEELGFELRNDVSMGGEFEGAGEGFRRLTVGPPDQPGVEFTQEPASRPYGAEAIFRDDSGNWFSLTRHTGDAS
jgi:hypothetical protein